MSQLKSRIWQNERSTRETPYKEIIKTHGNWIMREMIVDLDTLIYQVHSHRIRPLFAEAISCYRAGAFRASILTTWLCVLFDLREKLEELDLLGEPSAKAKIEEWRKADSTNDMALGLKIERDLIKYCQEKLELIDTIGVEDLKRIQFDRNRCSHSSVLEDGTMYYPAPELVRSHIVNAFEHLLRHPPTQGKASLDQLLRIMERESFPSSKQAVIDIFKKSPLGRPKDSLLRTFILMLLKRITIDTQKSVSDMTHTEQTNIRRAVQAIEGIIEIHRVQVSRILNTEFLKLVDRTDDCALWGTLVLLGSVSEAWNYLQSADQNRLKQYILTAQLDELRHRLGWGWRINALEDTVVTKISQLEEAEWIQLGKTQRAPNKWIDVAINSLSTVDSWNSANVRFRNFLMNYIAYITSDQIDRIVHIAYENSEVSDSNGFKEFVNQWGKAHGHDRDWLRAQIIGVSLDDKLTHLEFWLLENDPIELPF